MCCGVTASESTLIVKAAHTVKPRGLPASVDRLSEPATRCPGWTLKIEKETRRQLRYATPNDRNINRKIVPDVQLGGLTELCMYI